MKNETLHPTSLAATALALLGLAATGFAGDEKKPDYPPFDKTIDGLEKVVSTTDGSSPLYDLYADKESGRLLAAVAPGYEGTMLLIAPTISGGDPEAGVMGGTFYCKWRKIGKQLALVAPDLSVRTSGDKQAKDSVEALFSDTIILSTPILTMAPGGKPVIDLGGIALGNSNKFFGDGGGYGPGAGRLNPSLATLTKVKAFPKNVLVEYEVPEQTGRLLRVTFDIGKLEGTPGFEPREADPRVGYFYDWHLDYARTDGDDLTDRYISRWHFEKADPKLKMSPPKQPLTWYIEHTTPIRYRRYVKEGIEMWNEAFAAIGIDGALQVLQQDSTTGAFMDLDPEDARYNFFRWNTSDEGYAIGPSRTDPMTGEILDADVVWNQGLTRGVASMLANLTDDLSDSTFSAETLAWFHEHPDWDPRVRVSSPARQEQLEAQRALEARKVVTEELTSEEHPWTRGANDHANRACRIGNQLAMDMSLAGTAFVTGLVDAESEEMLDGLPEEFLGAMIRYISAHEVGHCLGLQHNMAASTIRTLEEINSEGFEGATIGSVMDYVAANINYELGDAQGPYATPTVGPYDHWAIAFGYGPKEKLPEVLAKVSEPDHVFLSQVAMSVGSDPRNMTWDMGADNLKFSESRLKLVQDLRSKLVTELTDEGESWREVRKRYNQLLGTHLSALFSASAWIGGSYENSDFKGDPGNRSPIEDVPADAQRRALHLIIENAFRDEAFGLTPELVRHMGKSYWWDPKGFDELLEDPSYTVHDQVGMFHAIGLSLVMNPTTLRRVYDNEFRTKNEPNPLTLAEVVQTVTKAVWGELDDVSGEFTATSPLCSSFRRNLQQEHTNRLVTLALSESNSASMRTISALAANELREIRERANEVQQGTALDPYTDAHLLSIRRQITKALDASYVKPR